MGEINETWLHIRDTKRRNYITDLSNFGNVKYGDGSVCASTMYQRVRVNWKTIPISHIVAENFVPKTSEDIAMARNLVDHKTHAPTDINVNDFRNLRWCTHKENSNFDECKRNMHLGMRGKARSEFGKWFNSIYPDGCTNHVNEYAYYFRRYRLTGTLPTELDYATTFNGKKSEFSIMYNAKYGKGSDNPVFYNKCRRHYLKTGALLEV